MRLKTIIGIIFFTSITLLQGQTPNELLLKDYRPQSIYKIPITTIDRPKFPVIDAHSHAYATSKEDVKQWVETMDYMGIEKTIILTGATGTKFDSLLTVYGQYPNHFDLWCGIDFTHTDADDWAEQTIIELKRCKQSGAKGVGEITDKGVGLLSAFGSESKGLHLIDPKMEKVLDALGALDMPINIHIAEPIWMYEKMDHNNDGLINGYTWRIDKEAEDVVLHAGLIKHFEQAVSRHTNTTFIACHFLNCSYDLSIIGNLLDKYPNLYADISARYAETAPIPRFMKNFYEKHQNKLLYGTDMGFQPEMYRITFRVLETEDEHFYETETFQYHWAMHGYGLSNKVLKKLYRNNARKLFK